MKSIQVVLDEKLLRTVDRAARRKRVNRSALIREALREHLKREQIRELEEQERIAYQRQPLVEIDGWDKVAVWPED